MPEVALVGGEPILRIRQLTKQFGEVVANEALSFDAWAGEVHCLLGENGAGKSTLISMLAGLQLPDAGSIELAGEPCEFASPADSLSRGIAVVYQHSTLVPELTVLENLMLVQPHFVQRRGEARAQLQRLEREHRGLTLAPDSKVRLLALGQRQHLEIAIAMSGAVRPRVLVLDEPTSMLSPEGVRDLHEHIRSLARHGVAVILVTHKLDEALALGDRVSVLRGGKDVLHLTPSELRDEAQGCAESKILEAMFGAEAGVPRPREPRIPEPEPTDLPSLELVNVNSASSPGEVALRGVSLRVNTGEVLGIAGIDGHGQKELVELITGQRRAVAGEIRLQGRNLENVGVRGRRAKGIRYLTDDRLHEGTAGSFSVALNLLLTRLGDKPFWRFCKMRQAEVESHARDRIEQYGIRVHSVETRVSTLSGGNIQKVMLARELEGTPAVIVCHKPTYGLDERTVQFVRERLREVSARGAAVLLVSSDLDELEALADRVAVISEGEIIGEAQAGPALREKVGALISQADRRCNEAEVAR